MGGEAWSYFTPFEKSVQAALEKRRDQVFESGKFRGSEFSPATPEEAFANMGDQGTASILDITEVSPVPEFCSVCPLAGRGSKVSEIRTRDCSAHHSASHNPIQQNPRHYAIHSTSARAGGGKFWRKRS